MKSSNNQRKIVRAKNNARPKAIGDVARKNGTQVELSIAVTLSVVFMVTVAVMVIFVVFGHR